jgi:hypothetical protein
MNQSQEFMSEYDFSDLENRVIGWLENVNQSNTRDTPRGTIRMPPYVQINGSNGVSIVRVTEDTSASTYIPAYQNMTLSPQQQQELRNTITTDMVNNMSRRGRTSTNVGGKSKKSKKTKRVKTRKSNSKKVKTRKSKAKI